MIKKNLISLYNWEFKDSPSSASISFEFPSEFNADSIEVLLNEDKDSILVAAPDCVPILCGFLYEKCKDAHHTKEGNIYTVTVEKEINGDWPMMVKSLHKELHGIDPVSSFKLYEIFSALEDAQSKKWGSQMLENSVRFGYLDAIYVYSSMLMEMKGMEDKAIQILLIGTENFDDPLCHFQLGIILVAKKNEPESALYHLNKAADAGINIANFSIGQIYSPISNVKYDKKDAKKTVEHFMKVPENERSPGLLSELAELYEKGFGVEKDLQMAEKYRKEANRRMQQMSGIQFTEEENTANQKQIEIAKKESRKNMGIIAATTISMAAAIGFVIYKKIKGKK